jgi:hypothetical protein
MRSDQRLATNPLHELWNEHGLVTMHEVRDLTAEDIVALLRTGAVRFVIADVGRSLHWVPSAQCYSFWKSAAKLHIVDPPHARTGIALDDFPEGYCYLASEWASDDEPIVLLQVVH